MNKIIYLKQEVNIGDIINFQDLKLTLTQEIVDNNPNLFEVKKELLFTTEDGVDIYKGDRVWYVNYLYTLCGGNQVYDKRYNHNAFTWFSTKEAAEAWITANKPEKTLEDYENILLKDTTNLYSFNNVTIDLRFLWDVFKEKEPKLYWLKVLQLIADDLNGEWRRAKIRDSQAWFIGKQYESNLDDYNSIGAKKHNTVDYGLVYFKDRSSCEKAISLLGNNIKYIL
ncbi:hypothetical protein [Tenacibaculum sp.]|uniref:hypothetical protein n=1 Tax=Tenacibaculum sp. TaxID=1906242 RepID=UPI003D13187D